MMNSFGSILACAQPSKGVWKEDKAFVQTFLRQWHGQKISLSISQWSTQKNNRNSSAKIEQLYKQTVHKHVKNGPILKLQNNDKTTIVLRGVIIPTFFFSFVCLLLLLLL